MTSTQKQTDGFALLESWDRQQTAFIRLREHRFNTIVTAVRGLTGDKPRILDLACGPGSLSRAIRVALPDAQIVACDKDPVLLAIAKDVFADDARTDVIDLDLDDAAGITALAGSFDAVICSTALHWLQPSALSALYFALADKIRPGGVFLNGDHFLYDAVAQSSLKRLAKEDDAAQQAEHFGSGVDTWDEWWSKATATPRYQDAVAERELVWAHKNGSTPKVTVGYHLETLRSAGFSEVGTIWQYLDDWVVAAVR